LFNGSEKDLYFKVCEPMAGKKWVRAVDTGLPSPDDILISGEEAVLENPSVYTVKEKSMVILISRLLY
jgi:glycogen operon protein